MKVLKTIAFYLLGLALLWFLTFMITGWFSIPLRERYGSAAGVVVIASIILGLRGTKYVE